jgi:hypothetical protein
VKVKKQAQQLKQRTQQRKWLGQRKSMKTLKKA